MYNNPLISVIIPNYNYAKYLTQAVESVLNQTYKKLEIIIVDDCSTDDSYQVYNHFKRNSNIRILVNEVNSGVVYSRNKGVENASGEYIALLDPDDYWHKDKLTEQLKVIEKEGCEIVCSALKVVNDLNEVIAERASIFKNINYNNMLKSNSIPHSSALIKRDVFNTEKYIEVVNPFFNKGLPFISGYKNLIHEDYAFLLRAIRGAKGRVCYINKPLVNYRKHQSNYSGSIIKKILSIYVIFRYQEQFSFLKSVYYTGRLLVYASVKNRKE